MSKVYSLVGDLHVKGLQLAFDAVGNEVMGRKIEMIVEDSAADPALGLSKAEKGHCHVQAPFLHRSDCEQRLCCDEGRRHALWCYRVAAYAGCGRRRHRAFHLQPQRLWHLVE